MSPNAQATAGPSSETSAIPSQHPVSGFDLSDEGMKYKSRAIWSKKYGQLWSTSDREFERAILPYLSVFWPELQPTAARGTLDRRGIDLYIPRSGTRRPVVIQCKGFIEPRVEESQLQQMEQSINAFSRSPEYCDLYLLLHNRDHRNTEGIARIRRRLDQLVESGKALQAEIWDLQTCQKRVFQQLYDEIRHALHAHSHALLEQVQQQFIFSTIYQPEVPISLQRLHLHHLERAELEPIMAAQTDNIANLLLDAGEESRWTLLTGQFGVGKTMSVLQTTLSQQRDVVLVQASKMAPELLDKGTSYLLGQMISALAIFDRYPPSTRLLLEELSGPVLDAHLKVHPSQLVLIIDGLDENRAYTQLAGFQLLSNQLADYACPIVLTTRREHFDAMFGNFRELLGAWAAKRTKWPKRSARIITLERWDDTLIEAFVAKALASTSGMAAQHLNMLLYAICQHETVTLYGDLLSNPLFLQFIVEDVAEHGVRPMNRCALLRGWAMRKIRRDRRTTNRITLMQGYDLDEFVAVMLQLMEDVAFAMTIPSPHGIALLEILPARELRQLAASYFPASHDADPVVAILLNSLLCTCGPRQGRELAVMFAFRILQEYCLAAYLTREGLSPAAYPATVRELYQEMAPTLLAIERS